MMRSQMKSCRCLAGRCLINSCTFKNSATLATSKLAAGVVKRLHDGRIAVGLDRVVDLHARQVLAELA